MTVDITALDELPETAPMADLIDLGLLNCSETCWFFTCLHTSNK